MPLKSIQFSTPYERLFHSPPGLSHLRVFGCLCYITTPKVQRSNFDPRTDSCVLIGYLPHQKAYKVLNFVTNKVVVSRDVTFYEKYFPFHFSSTPSTDYSTKFFLPIVTPFSTEDSSSSNTILDPLQTDQLTFSSPPPSLTSLSHNIYLTTSFSSPNTSVPIRRSTRATKTPSHLKDFIYPKITRHWCNLVAFDDLRDKHKLLIAAHLECIEPTSYKEASEDANWIEAMNKELTALQHNKTWDFVPKGKKTIGCKWVYRIKKNADGSIERYKARLVAKGFTQR